MCFIATGGPANIAVQEFAYIRRASGCPIGMIQYKSTVAYGSDESGFYIGRDVSTLIIPCIWPVGCCCIPRGTYPWEDITVSGDFTEKDPLFGTTSSFKLLYLPDARGGQCEVKLYGKQPYNQLVKPYLARTKPSGGTELGANHMSGAPTTMQVQCPQGMVPGEMIQIQTPSGPMNVPIPAGVAPGATFLVQVPTAAPPVTVTMTR